MRINETTNRAWTIRVAKTLDKIARQTARIQLSVCYEKQRQERIERAVRRLAGASGSYGKFFGWPLDKTGKPK